MLQLLKTLIKTYKTYGIGMHVFVHVYVCASGTCECMHKKNLSEDTFKMLIEISGIFIFFIIFIYLLCVHELFSSRFSILKHICEYSKLK